MRGTEEDGDDAGRKRGSRPTPKEPAAWFGPSTRLPPVIGAPILLVFGCRALFRASISRPPHSAVPALIIGTAFVLLGAGLAGLVLLNQWREEAMFGMSRRETMRLGLSMVLMATTMTLMQLALDPL